MTDSPIRQAAAVIPQRIVTFRGQKVILDADLAALYGVPVKRLNEQVKRNISRFPEDFMFRLTAAELKTESAPAGNRSQFATGSSKHRDPRFPPYAFTEHGAIMAATVLNSPRAVEMSVFIVRAFVRMRQALLARNAIEKRLDVIEKTLLVHDSGLRDLYDKLRPLLLPPPDPPRKAIGFGVKERRAAYRTRKLRMVP